MTRVVVADYGLGNLFNVAKALEAVGAEVVVTSEPKLIASAAGLVLPGVGAFGDGMSGLLSRDLVAPLKDVVASGRPLLGICLGMQLLLSESEEFGRTPGLGLIPGRVRSLASDARFKGKLPHVGWSALEPERPWTGTLLDGLARGVEVYFVHSFAAHPEASDVALARTEHGGASFCSVLEQGNVAGCQFHPEKSRAAGLSILLSFVKRVARASGSA